MPDSHSSPECGIGNTVRAQFADTQHPVGFQLEGRGRGQGERRREEREAKGKGGGRGRESAVEREV